MFEPPRPSIRSPSLKHQKLALLLAFLVIAAVSLLAFLSIQRLTALGTRVEQTQSFLLETSRFVSHLKDVENGARGYFVTGDERYLLTQQAGIAKAAIAARRLRELQDGAEVERRLDHLFDLAARRIAGGGGTRKRLHPARYPHAGRRRLRGS